ncbi:MAG: hypothetical protein U0U09_05060 [Cyclobacteriaceae bacterium]
MMMTPAIVKPTFSGFNSKIGNRLLCDAPAWSAGRRNDEIASLRSQ